MTLRDFTLQQLNKLQRRCEIELGQWRERTKLETRDIDTAWKQAWSNGLKAGLEIKDKEQ